MTGAISGLQVGARRTVFGMNTSEIINLKPMTRQEHMAYLATLYERMGDHEAAEICRLEAARPGRGVSGVQVARGAESVPCRLCGRVRKGQALRAA